jgi:hypothetical protein
MVIFSSPVYNLPVGRFATKTAIGSLLYFNLEAVTLLGPGDSHQNQSLMSVL